MTIDDEFVKDPDAILDYTVDWSEWLDTDTIASSDWEVPSGMSEQSSSNTTLTATVWLSGGTTDNTYAVVNRIVTAAGRTDDRTIYIRVEEK